MCCHNLLQGRDDSEFVNILKIFIQNPLTSFNKSWHKASMGKGIQVLQIKDPFILKTDTMTPPPFH